MTSPLEYINWDVLATWPIVGLAAYTLFENTLKIPQHFSKSLDKNSLELVIKQEYKNRGFKVNKFIVNADATSGYFKYDKSSSELTYFLSEFKVNKPGIEKSIDMSKHNDEIFNIDGTVKHFSKYVLYNAFYNVKHFNKAVLNEVSNIYDNLSLLRKIYIPDNKKKELRKTVSFIYESQYKKK